MEKTNSQVSELAYLQVLINTDQLQESMNSFKITLLIAMAIAFLVSVFLSLALTNRALKPVLKSWDKQQAFVANASHELRTPLAVMQSQLEALFLTPEKTVVEASEPIATTLSEIRRLTKLSNDLLLLARFDAKQSFSQKKSVDIADFLENITEPYTELAASLGKQLVIDNSAFEKVLVDPEQMQQVLLILLDNALKFTGTDGKIVITSRVTDKYWQLSVADNGVGFDEKDQEKIFERFYREDTARTTKGSGLGLSIAKMIIESHGGKLVAKKNQGKGAIFSWQIPLRF
ncbi:sensor histidine kinase [Enterococcus timonensis]|uniref:sensor histidine kinase n=1 Tax=Enterococcus timonensis TaxID=1852364 RepID=UPI0009F48078|nr:HAMP domain-containing sensor histidine kinase [Enterococcus timonensis]